MADMMADAPNFVTWTGGDNSRLAGKMQWHYRLKFDADGDCMMQVFKGCREFRRTMTKLFISQPMRGRRMADIVRERKTLVADAAVALQEDEIAVLDTLFDDTDATPLALLARALGKLAEADAVIFAPGWETARGCRMEHLAAEEYGIRIVEG